MSTAARKHRKRMLRKTRAIGEIANPDQFRYIKAQKVPTGEYRTKKQRQESRRHLRKLGFWEA